MSNSRLNKIFKVIEPVCLILSFLLLLLTAWYGIEGAGLISIIIIILAMLPFFARFELTKPKPRDIVPLVVLSALASIGRLAFTALPNFKPVTAIVIVSALSFGSEGGFMVGALSALGSNMFFGQGPWTPWQMFAWGFIGYLAGQLKKSPIFKFKKAILGYGFLSGFIFGWIMNLWYIIGFINPISWQSILASYVASFYFDLTHGIATVVFLIPILGPWTKKLERIKTKFGLMGDRQ